jgi:SAM-dependent methyltransferase
MPDIALVEPPRVTAYTTPRPDISAMVPDAAVSLLDVGCSNGALGRSLKSAVPRRRVVGMEIDADFCAQARHHLDEVICANLNTFDWQTVADAQFDCIIFGDVLEHLIDPAACLAAARRKLAPGGCMVISLPNVRHVSSFLSIFVRGTFPRRDRGIFDRTHLRWFTIDDARALVAGAGLRVERIDYVLRLGDQGGGLANKLLHKLLGRARAAFPVREFFTYQFCLRAVAAG